MMTETMKNRLSMILTGTLYFGAMLAGLAGYGWALIFAFAGIFFIGLAVQTPSIWPERLADWLQPETLSRNGMRIAIQLALVIFCFAVGRGVGGVAGTLPGVPLGLPLGIALISLPVARMLRVDTAARAADEPAAETGAKEA
jgi:hypothetical protein